MSTRPTNSRRAFLEKLFTASVVAVAAPGVVLSAVTPRLRMNKGQMLGDFKVKISQNAALANIDGSVKLSVAGLMDQGQASKVVITRTGQNTFAAVSSVCRHLQCSVATYNASTKVIECPCHGSKYDATGVVVGGPAQANLTAYPATFDGSDTVTVTLPVAAVLQEDVVHAWVKADSVRGSGAVTVRFAVDAPAHVLMGVYDLTGRQVLTLADEVYQPGEHRLACDTKKLASGSYICRMQTSTGYTHSAKMTIEH